MSDHFTLTRLNKKTQEYEKVEYQFLETIQNVKINYVSLFYFTAFLLFLTMIIFLKIDKVHNEHLLQMYEFSKKLISERNPLETKNEYLLFHGSDNSSIELNLSEDLVLIDLIVEKTV